MAYLKIKNLYANKTILLFRQCHALEKCDGTSSYIHWDGKDLCLFAGGSKHEHFVALFDQDALKAKFTELFGLDKVTVYGEAYGGKLQGMSATYGKELRFVAFEAKVRDSWVTVPNAEDIAGRLGLEFVPYATIPTDLDAINAERDRDSEIAIRRGMGAGHLREGVVLRPLIEVVQNNGEREIAKHKRPECSERASNPKVTDPVEDKLWEDARSAAQEWVTAGRLSNVLSKLPPDLDLKDTGTVCKAMIADILVESEGKVIDTQAVRKELGKETARLFKKRIMESI